MMKEHIETQKNNLTQEQKQAEIIHALAGDFVAIYYVDVNTGAFDIFRKVDGAQGLIQEERTDINYFETAFENGKKYVIPEDMDFFVQSSQKEVILEQLKKRRKYQFVVRVFYKGEPTYFEYRFIRPFNEETEDKMIVGVYNVDQEMREDLQLQKQMEVARQRVDELKKKNKKLSADAYMDALTGLYNRRAYEEDLKDGLLLQTESDFAYVAFDVNGLKNANDSLGHDAGDELLKGAAYCMNECLSSYGKLYRIGGDEFVALICASSDKMQELKQDFDDTVSKWSGNEVKSLSVSYGCVLKSDFPEYSLLDMEKLADKRMYQDKANYYASKGIDRRGRQEAFEAVCRSYTKILKVNLTTDTFLEIQLLQNEKSETKGYDEHISLWLRNFANSGQVHEADREEYLKNTDINYLRQFFKTGNSIFSIFYRRMIGNEFKKAMMEMIPANEYTDEEQIVFLYVKNIDK